ncbi:hypothetical protein N5F00_16050 [Pseudomonas chengduensis]|nr:hypothetical protein [Pseudomonas chengduensis]MDH1731007.1 hypothetical protein [Pseudomonas chengduensis]
MPAGVYRRVFIASRWAIKIPRIKNITSGARCNRWEAEVWRKWRPKFGWEHLCPVRFCDPLGLILVMDRASQPVTFEEVISANDQEYNDYYPNVDLEYKAENWGVLAGRMVCVDYGIDDAEQIANKRIYFQERSRT